MNGRHAKQSVWVFVQQYNTVVKEFRMKTVCVVLSHCKDRSSFDDALDENNIVPREKERRAMGGPGDDEALENFTEYGAAVLLYSSAAVMNPPLVLVLFSQTAILGLLVWGGALAPNGA